MVRCVEETVARGIREWLISKDFGSSAEKE